MQRLRIENLPPDISIADIDNFCSPFGEIVHIGLKIHANPLIVSVQFADERSTLEAEKSINGYNHKGYTLIAKLVEVDNGNSDRSCMKNRKDPALELQKLNNHIKKREEEEVKNTKCISRWDRDKK